MISGTKTGLPGIAGGAFADMKGAEVYDSANRPPPAVEELAQLWRYRELVVQLVVRNIKARYKRSVLGVLWTMLNPLLMMGVLTLVFSGLFKLSVPDYSVYLLAGLLFWQFFSQATVASTSEIVWGASIVKRVYVPRTVFAVAAVGNGMVNLALSLAPLALIMIALGVPIGPAALFTPVAVLMAAMFTLGIALFVSSLAVHFADFAEIYQIALTAWMYLTPVIYPMDIVPGRLRRLFEMNPLYCLLESFRAPIHSGLLPSPTVFGTAAAVSLLTLLLGWLFFTRSADEIAYRA
jgi:ABC-type polysaccharide/polyol phosphate export permease